MARWEVERVVHFDFVAGDLCKDGFVHFGFHDRAGNRYVLEHKKHFLGLLGEGCRLEWTVAAHTVFEGVRNISTTLQFPIYIDSMLDGTLVISNFGSSLLYRINADRKEATLFVDGSAIGMKHAGNCVVDDEGFVWVNEVEGCRVWRFDPAGRPVLILGDGQPGFQLEATSFEDARFNWIYDIRRGPDGNVYVLDSKNFAIRMIDVRARRVHTIAGTGVGGYEGDGGDARFATFGSSRTARFNGPISLSLDEEGNIFVGDRYNFVVRMIDRKTNVIDTIAGDHSRGSEEANDPSQRNPLNLNLPKISSMDYHGGRLFVPTDLAADTGDLAVLRRSR
ncbi:MAG: hypothetical protein LYZ69_02060 [Nitrososphaerales archaeon]|nr:hypothetical protein [Nitrososphaerales archaeon]